MGETRVDLHHLLEDLRDAYPGPLEETILTEIIANSLDSGATRIGFGTDAARGVLTVVDDGSGMQRRELKRYHDIAASTKTRGEGIGFAGVGIKLGLLICEEVYTETRRGKTHVATRWHLASRHRAPWKWVPPQGQVPLRGTAVQLKPHNALSPLLDSGFIEGAIRRHYQPLLDPAFAEILAAHYPRGVAFEINGALLAQRAWEAAEKAALQVRLARKRKPSAVGYLVREPLPLPEERRGPAISTFGKIIKHGWDWLGVTPAAPEQIGGLIEAPALAGCLTLNKADFIRSGPRGATYLAYRKAIQEAVSQQLAAWGEARDAGADARRRATKPLERDLERVLVELAEEFPLLAALVEHRAGGQKRLPIGRPGEARELVAASLAAAARPAEAEAAGAQATAVEEAPRPESQAPEPPPSASQEPAQPQGAPALPTAGPRKPQRYGLTIEFEQRPDDPELGRLRESTVWVNTAHPAYRRAAASRSEGYHIALAVALALAPLAAESATEHGFVTAFLARWGEAVEKPGRRRKV